jgi:hypothetical protein
MVGALFTAKAGQRRYEEVDVPLGPGEGHALTGTHALPVSMTLIAGRSAAGRWSPK